MLTHKPKKSSSLGQTIGLLLRSSYDGLLSKWLLRYRAGGCGQPLPCWSVYLPLLPLIIFPSFPVIQGSGMLRMAGFIAEVTDEFLTFSASRGNDLRQIGLTGGCKWCLCVSRWKEAMEARKNDDDPVVPKSVLFHSKFDALLCSLSPMTLVTGFTRSLKFDQLCV